MDEQKDTQTKWNGPFRKPGRPKGTRNSGPLEDVKVLARQHGREALETLATIMKDLTVPAAARVAAANSLLDRGYGKALQPNEHSGPGGKPVTFEFVVRRAGQEADAALEAPRDEPINVTPVASRPAFSVVGEE